MLIIYEKSGNSNAYELSDTLKSSVETLVFSENFNKSDSSLLAEIYELDKNQLDDSFDINELPRVDEIDRYRYVYLRNFEIRSDKIISHPVLFVLGPKLFACLSISKTATNASFKIPDKNDKPKTNQQFLSHGILQIVKHYEEAIDLIGDNISKIEKRMRSHEANNQDFFSFVGIESNLNRANTNLQGLYGVVDKLQPKASTRAEQDKLDDIRLFTKQLLVEVESHLQSIKSIRETYSTVANNTLNQRMKALTVLTLLIALPNVFFGMYGMNIRLPFMNEHWAYSFVVGFSLLVMITVYVLAKRRRLF